MNENYDYSLKASEIQKECQIFEEIEDDTVVHV